MGMWNSLLDRSVVFSFDRTGYRRHAKAFDAAHDRMRLTDRTFLITGCNSGIGLAAVQQLARRGAHVVLACRSVERGHGAIAQVKHSVPDAHLELRQVDMADLDSVSRLSETIEGPLHGLIHNAGNMLDHCQHTDQQIEYITSLHVAGPYCLSIGLQKQLEAGVQDHGARILFVSSGGMYTQGLRTDELFAPSGRYDGMRHYAHTKRAQVVLAQQLHERFRAQAIAVHSMHPGWVDTAAVRRAMPKFALLTRRILRAPEEGADTISWLAGYSGSDIDAESGFWFDRARAPLFPLSHVVVTEEQTQRMMARLERLAQATQVTPS